MELDEFMVIVTLLSLFLAVISLLINLVKSTEPPATVVIQAKPLSSESEAQARKIKEMHDRLFNK